ncbi:MAG: flagellar protein export ATPase FliI, partial [Betaproteobacteria bacterium]|nr:flagellar protein export ATPase FliI [Betaproteobacteria bacterium]
MPRIEQLRKYVQDCAQVAESTPKMTVTGRLTRVTGLVMEAVGLRLAVGSSCSVILPNGKDIDAEVVGFADDRLFLMPASDVYGVVPGARVVPVEHPVESPRLDAPPRPRRRASDQARHVPVGPGLLGRVLDSTGKPLDGLGPLLVERNVSLHGRALNPLERAP